MIQRNIIYNVNHGQLEKILNIIIQYVYTNKINQWYIIKSNAMLVDFIL